MEPHGRNTCISSSHPTHLSFYPPSFLPLSLYHMALILQYSFHSHQHKPHHFCHNNILFIVPALNLRQFYKPSIDYINITSAHHLKKYFILPIPFLIKDSSAKYLTLIFLYYLFGEWYPGNYENNTVSHALHPWSQNKILILWHKAVQSSILAKFYQYS